MSHCHFEIFIWEIHISLTLVRFGLASSVRKAPGDILPGITSPEPIKSPPPAQGVSSSWKWASSSHVARRKYRTRASHLWKIIVPRWIHKSSTLKVTVVRIPSQSDTHRILQQLSKDEPSLSKILFFGICLSIATSVIQSCATVNQDLLTNQDHSITAAFCKQKL